MTWATRPGAGRHVVVVGAGLAGLAAAWFLTQDVPRGGPGAIGRITVLEQAPQVGGKLALGEVAGVVVDTGAESLLARRPEAVELVRAVGLGDDLVAPETTRAALWSRGRMVSLPAGQVMGVPGNPRALAASGLLTPFELLRVGLDPLLPAPGDAGDVSVGGYVARRLGRAVVDRLVDPLLGGVYAGRADLLSLDATLPQLAPAAHRGGSLLTAAQEVLARAAASTGPVFAGIAGGVGRLPVALAAALSAPGRGDQAPVVEIRTRTTVRELVGTATGFRVATGSTRHPEVLEADAVVVTAPAHHAARLLATVAPTAATELAGIEYASTVLVTFALALASMPGSLSGSGLLVPAVDGRAVKAATFSSNKWGWMAAAAPGLAVVRASLGRYGDEAVLARPDEELAELALGELAHALGVRDRPVDASVTRWGGALPQYQVGHVERVRRAYEAVAAVPGLAVAGAAYHGVGIPAVIASARQAARQVGVGTPTDHRP
ncbi:MAG: protoporphyrinogen oxidase [Actinomycetes bacterium]